MGGLAGVADLVQAVLARAEVGQVLGECGEVEHELEGGGGVAVSGKPAHHGDEPRHGAQLIGLPVTGRGLAVGEAGGAVEGFGGVGDGSAAAAFGGSGGGGEQVGGGLGDGGGGGVVAAGGGVLEVLGGVAGGVRGSA